MTRDAMRTGARLQRTPVPGAMQRAALRGVMLRRTGTVPNAGVRNAPALQRAAPQVLRAALRPGYGGALPGCKFLFQSSLNNTATTKKRGETHEAWRGDCGNHEAGGDRDPLRLSGQSSDRIR